MLPINKHFVFDIVDLYQANPQRLIASVAPLPSYEREGQKQKGTRKRKRTSRKSSINAPQKKIDLEKEVPKGETFKNIFTTYIFSIIHGFDMQVHLNPAVIQVYIRSCPRTLFFHADQVAIIATETPLVHATFGADVCFILLCLLVALH